MTVGRVGRHLACALAAATLTACASGPNATRVDSPNIRPDANGIGIAGEVQRVDFGRTLSSTVDAVSQLLGAPPATSVLNPECGAGPTTIVQYPQIDLLFLDDTFRGWVTQNPGTVAGNGLSPGVTRTQLENGGYGPFEETTLGVEFDAAGVFGQLPTDDDSAPIQTLWAGTNCFFR